MKSKRKNIIICFAVLLLASFAISYSHTLLEQIGNNCTNHEEHDFSKVIVNVVLKDNSAGDDSLSMSSFPFIADNYDIFQTSYLTDDHNGYFHHPPAIFYDHIYIKKFKSLLI